MKIGVLGSGDVAKALADGFIKHGHQTMMGTRDTGEAGGVAAQQSQGAGGQLQRDRGRSARFWRLRSKARSQPMLCAWREASQPRRQAGD